MTDPEATFRRIVDDPPIGWAVGIVVVVSLVYGLNAALSWGGGEPWMAVFPAEPPAGRLALGGAFVPVIFWVLHPLVAGVLRLTAGVLGGHGEYRAMFTGYAFALTPSALTILGLLPDPFGWLGSLFAVWTLVLVFYAVGATERLSMGRSLAVLGLPLVVVGTAAAAALIV